MELSKLNELIAANPEITAYIEEQKQLIQEHYKEIEAQHIAEAERRRDSMCKHPEDRKCI